MNQRSGLILYFILASAVVAASIHAGISFLKSEDTSMTGMQLRGVIDADASQHLPGLTVGHNYELLHLFAEAQDDTLTSVILAGKGTSYIDSLKRGAVDIVVLPYQDSIYADSVSFSIPVEGTMVWAIRSEYKEGLALMNRWLEEYSSTEEYESRKELFLLRFSPNRRAVNGRITAILSPYDELMKKYASEIGWDWRLLAALIYKESQFHIEVSSHRGAEGLMQIRRRTAERFGETDLLNPENNIKAGTAFIKRLQDMFKKNAADPDELQKFVLAAYNAGEGRLKDCITFTEYCGSDSGYWDNIAKAIPHMRDSSVIILDTLEHGIFYGDETISYVGEVLKLYDDFKRICPKDAATEP